MPRVSITSTDKVFEVSENSILYNALADQGLDLPHGCLAGSCGACRIDVRSGFENLAPASAIEHNTLESIVSELTQTEGAEKVSQMHIRLSCRAKVLGDVEFIPLGRAFL
jgi:ferredoxin